MPYPDDFSSALYNERWGRDEEPDMDQFAATDADVAALRAVRQASAAFLAVLRANPWSFDSAETVSHADHVAEHAAIDAQIEAALAEAEASRRPARPVGRVTLDQAEQMARDAVTIARASGATGAELTAAYTKAFAAAMFATKGVAR